MIQHLFACFGASVAYNSNVAWMRCISLQKRIQRKKLKLHTFWMQNVLLIFFIINETSFRVFFAGYFEKHLHFILFYATMTQCIYWFLYFLVIVILSDFCILVKLLVIGNLFATIGLWIGQMPLTTKNLNHKAYSSFENGWIPN